MAIELENEKAKTDRLLHEMLPKKVADQLKQGKTVEAGKIEPQLFEIYFDSKMQNHQLS